jgi:crotonobetainyl-CoA hydratase
MSDLVQVGRDGHVATVTLNRPDQRNAISISMLEDLTEVFGQLSSDPDARVAVLTGGGNDFCAGADFSDLTIMQPPAHDYGRSFEEAVGAITTCSIPVVASVRGAALGAGCQVVVACDLAIVSTEAKLGIPAARLGLVINFENIQRLVLSVGPKRAGEIMYTGRVVSGNEAASWGLVNEAVPEPELHARTAELAAMIAEGAPLTARASKRGIGVVMEKLAVDRAAEGHRVGDFDMMAAEAFGSEDLKEGVRAFKERRKPRFTGK